MTNTFGEHSRAELVGVRPELVSVVRLALQKSPVDFTVVDGLRSVAEQEEYVRTGASLTLLSKHLRQPDGFGHATDLVPWINGRLRWEMKPCMAIAEAVRDAAMELGTVVRWGGSWSILTPDLDVERSLNAYVTRKVQAGETPFLDGPHYELARPRK